MGKRQGRGEAVPKKPGDGEKPELRVVPPTLTPRHEKGEGREEEGEEGEGNDVFEQALAHVREGLSLNPNQRRFLSLRLLYASDADCCEGLGVSRDRAYQWKQRYPDFVEAYRRLFTEGIEAWAARQLRQLLGKAVVTVEDMLTAQSPKTIRGANADGQKVTEVVEAPDWYARGKGIELVYRPLGLWGEKVQVEANSALAEALREYTALLEQIRAERQQGHVIEGQARELPAPER